MAIVFQYPRNQPICQREIGAKSCCRWRQRDSAGMTRGYSEKNRGDTENTENIKNSVLSVLSVPPWFDPGDQRLRPYVSCDETQSSDEMAAASEISPASATPATISANFCTLPRP